MNLRAAWCYPQEEINPSATAYSIAPKILGNEIKYQQNSTKEKKVSRRKSGSGSPWEQVLLYWARWIFSPLPSAHVLPARQPNHRTAVACNSPISVTNPSPFFFSIWLHQWIYGGFLLHNLPTKKSNHFYRRTKKEILWLDIVISLFTTKHLNDSDEIRKRKVLGKRNCLFWAASAALARASSDSRRSASLSALDVPKHGHSTIARCSSSSPRLRLAPEASLPQELLQERGKNFVGRTLAGDLRKGPSIAVQRISKLANLRAVTLQLTSYFRQRKLSISFENPTLFAYSHST